MTQEQNENQKQEEKELKRLLDAHVLVLKNKFGRTPTMEEIQESLGKGEDSTETPIASAAPNEGEPAQQVESPNQEPSGEQPDLEKGGDLEEGGSGEPKILDTTVYYGMADGEEGEKKPDPNKVLFYETPDNQCYCTESQEWLTQRPSVLDHLPSRSIEYSEQDIVNAIAHGVMGDSDYDALDKAGMLTDTPRKLWGLVKKMKTQMEQLEKSEESEEQEEPESEDDFNEPTDETSSDEELEDEVDQDYLPEGHSESSGEDMLREFLDTAGIDESQSEDLVEVMGEDALARIMEAATRLAMSGLEEQIRQIVRDELSTSSSDSEELSYETEQGGAETVTVTNPYV